MRILLTGASGFAGRNFMEYFLAQGHEVIGIYRQHKPQLPGRFIQRNLSQPIEVEGQFDAIVHTAAASRGTYQEFKRDNMDAMEQLIAFARRKHIHTFVNISTRSIYGEVRTQEVFEETDKINPDAYGQTKYGAEMLLREASDLNSISLRVPGISGRGAHNIWLTRTVQSFQANEDVRIADFVTKNFVWVMDIARFAEKLIAQSLQGLAFKYKVVNLACAAGENNLNLAREIKRRLGSSSQIIPVKPGKGLFLLNADKAFEVGYESHTPMEIVDMYLDTLTTGGAQV